MRRRLAWFFGLILVVLATRSATSGLLWSTFFHPDELPIAHWLDVVQREGCLSHRAYPSGWFELYRIRFWFEKNIPKWLDSWHGHCTQDGRVAAYFPDSYAPCGFNAVPTKKHHDIQDGRDFNAWLYVFTVVFLYLACLEAGFHPVAAFLSTLFFLASPGPLEFIHYCETDAGLLVSMAFFAWLAARSLRKQSSALALAASFAAGFAVACKPTLLPLLLWCLVSPVVVPFPRGGTRCPSLPKVVCLTLVSLALACGGYLWGTPAFRADPGRYMELLRMAKASTFAEIRRDLGGDYTWRGAVVLRLSSLLRHLVDMGALPLVWGLFSWSFWFVPRFRRQLAGIPWLLPVFLPFLVCWCPFVRRQELLPLSILLSMGAALPLQWWLSRPADQPPLGRRGRIAAVAMALLGICALLHQYARAAGMSSCFRMRETRAEAQNWLFASLPGETPVAFDDYVGQVARSVPVRAIGWSGLPFLWAGSPPEYEGVVARYYVENEGFPGRKPIRNPKTGRIYSHVRQRIADYNASVFPVRTWGVSRTTPVPTFAQLRTRLVSFDMPSPSAFDVPIGYSRPLLVLPDKTHLYDADGPAGIGPLRAVHTVGKRTSIHLNLEDGPRWLVTRMLTGDDSVRIVREGLFHPGKSELGVRGGVAARLAPSLWERMGARAAAHSTMRCRMRGDDKTIFCASYLTPSVAEAARELRASGNPAAALDLLRAESGLDAAGRVEAFLAASALGERPETEWEEAAREALAAADRLAADRDALGRTGVTLCGVPLGVVDDFARVRLDTSLREPAEKLPLWLPPGQYSLVLVPRIQGPLQLPSRLFDVQSADFSPAGDSENGQCLAAPLTVESGQFLQMAETGDGTCFDAFPYLLEITWSPVDQVLSAAEHLRSVLAGDAPESPSGTGDKS